MGGDGAGRRAAGAVHAANATARSTACAGPRTALPAVWAWLPLIGGAIVLIAFMTENAAENWSALHIEKTLGGSPAEGAMGPAALALTMGLARLAGQGLITARIIRSLLLTGGALISPPAVR